MPLLADIIYENKEDFLDKLTDDCPVFTDLLILTLQLHDSEKKAILEVLTSCIKDCYASRLYM